MSVAAGWDVLVASQLAFIGTKEISVVLVWQSMQRLVDMPRSPCHLLVIQLTNTALLERRPYKVALFTSLSICLSI